MKCLATLFRCSFHQAFDIKVKVSLDVVATLETWFHWTLWQPSSDSCQTSVAFWLISLSFSERSRSSRTKTTFSSWLFVSSSADFRCLSISACNAMSVSRNPLTWTLTVTLIGVEQPDNRDRDRRILFRISRIRNLFFVTMDGLTWQSRLRVLLQLESWNKRKWNCK